MVAYGDSMWVNVSKNIFGLIQFPFYLVSFTYHLIVVLMRGKIDIIHLHWLIPHGIIVIPLGRFLQIPVIVTVHGTDIRLLPNCLSSFLLHMCNAVISPHPEISRILEALDVNYVQIHNIIPESESATPMEIYRSLNLPFSDSIISYVARFDPFKDPITFVRAAGIIDKKKPNILCVAAGDGPQMKDVRKLASGIPSLHIPGFLDHPGNLLSISSIFVALSPIENIWSVTLVEAMREGIPCIVTKSGTTGDHLRHLEHVYLIEPKNPEALATAVLWLLDNPGIMKAIGAKGRELIHEIFGTNEDIVEQVTELYWKTIEGEK